MKHDIIKIASLLRMVLNKQGEEAKKKAIQQILKDFETSTILEMQHDFDNNDFSDMDDLSQNLNIYQELNNQFTNLKFYSKIELKEFENKILKVYDYYEKKYYREIDNRNIEQRKNYIDTILTPLILISLFFKEKSD